MVSLTNLKRAERARKKRREEILDMTSLDKISPFVRLFNLKFSNRDTKLERKNGRF